MLTPKHPEYFTQLQKSLENTFNDLTAKPEIDKEPTACRKELLHHLKCAYTFAKEEERRAAARANSTN